MLVVILAIVGVAAVTPVNAFTGQSSPVLCKLNLTVTGTYNDYLLYHSVSGFTFNGGGTGCATQTLLSLIPGGSSQFVQADQLNLFAINLPFSVVLVNQADGTQHGPYTINANIPAGSAAPSYSFTATTTVANFPEGTFTATITGQYISDQTTTIQVGS